MREVIQNHLNYVAVLIVTAVGFLLGWLWYSPVMFAKPWMRAMKLTEADMKQVMADGVAGYFIQGFICTLLSTFGLAVLITLLRADVIHGAAYGAFFGLFGPGMRMLNGGVWERASKKLQAIKVSHEVVLYAVQGAILAFLK
jgi:hypothetical protein